MKAKKLTAVALAGVMALSMAGCGNGNSGSNTASNNNTASDSNASSSSTAADNSTGSDSSTPTSTTGEKLVVWTLADDLKQFADRYTEQTGVDIEVNVIAPADYSTKVSLQICPHWMQRLRTRS